MFSEDDDFIVQMFSEDDDFIVQMFSEDDDFIVQMFSEDDDFIVQMFCAQFPFSFQFFLFKCISRAESVFSCSIRAHFSSATRVFSSSIERSSFSLNLPLSFFFCQIFQIFMKGILKFIDIIIAGQTL